MRPIGRPFDGLGVTQRLVGDQRRDGDAVDMRTRLEPLDDRPDGGHLHGIRRPDGDTVDVGERHVV